MSGIDAITNLSQWRYEMSKKAKNSIPSKPKAGKRRNCIEPGKTEKTASSASPSSKDTNSITIVAIGASAD